MNLGRKYRLIALVGVILVILTFGPTILAAKSGPPEYSFGGFLLNPIDGATYLAKMYLGWRGDWKFTLPYSVESGPGAYLNIFYIFLGHLARLCQMPLIVVFHLARLASIGLLLFSLYAFLEKTLIDSKLQGTALMLVAIGSGMGWLAIPFGGFTSDFWVAEMYPFLSAYYTPHFTFGLALLLFIVTPESDPSVASGSFPWVYVPAAVVLALVYPFGIVIAVLILGGRLALQLWLYSQKKIRVALKSRVVWIGLSGGPILLYDLLVVQVNPLLSEWNSQNITVSPSLWDLVLSLSPFLWLAIPGAIQVIKRKNSRELTLVLWVGLGLLLIYFPFSQQRRFLVGLFVPIVALAIIGLERLTRGSQSHFRLYSFIVFGLAIPTNLVVLVGGYHAIQTHDLRIYMTQAEVSAFQWLRSNTADDALILASPQTGLLIPGQTGRRVIYGHPFESMRAQTSEEAVKSFYETGDPSILIQYPIQYIFYGPREAELNPTFLLPGLEQVYSARGVSIYAVPP